MMIIFIVKIADSHLHYMLIMCIYVKSLDFITNIILRIKKIRVRMIVIKSTELFQRYTGLRIDTALNLENGMELIILEII